MSTREESNTPTGHQRNPLRRRRTPVPFQSEIQPASSTGESSGVDNSFISKPLTVPELLEQLRHPSQDSSFHSAISEIIVLTKERNERRTKEFIANGAIPILLRILSDQNSHDIETKIRVAAAICNLSQSSVSKRSFCSCYAIPTLVRSVIGEHQALTGAAALMMKSMLTSEFLVKSMVEYEAPIFLLRALILCTNIDICDTVVDVLIQMTTVKDLKDFLLEHKAVETCIYLLHVLARGHYFSVLRASEGFEKEDASQPSFTFKSMREVAIWCLTHQDGDSGNKSEQEKQPPAESTSPEVMFFARRMSHDGWEQRLKKDSFLSFDESKVPFTETDAIRASLFLEFLACLLNDSPNACAKITVMQFSLDILRYWMQNGTPLMRQSALLSTCFLLRNGHRGFVTLRDIISVIYQIIGDYNSHAGIRFVQYKGIAVEAINDLCIFGGDNVRLAIDAAGIIPLMLQLVEMDDYQLQHLTLRALHSICSHFYPLRSLVASGGIPFLCTYLSNGLKDLQTQLGVLRRTRNISKGPLGCLSRKRVPTFEITEAEVVSSQKQEESYSRFRRLDYCAALIRRITAIQSAEWLHTLNKCRIVPLALDGLIQTQSTVIRKQCLGILTSLVTMKDNNAVMNIGLEDGCELLLNLRSHSQRSQDPEASYWIAWINLILYHIAQYPKLFKLLEQAVKSHYSEQIEITKTSLSRMFKPNQAHLDLEWISSCL